MEKLKEGEKYLSISISVLGKWFNLTAFPKKTKEGDKEPDFVGEGIRVWVKKKKPKENNIIEDIL